jgi:hypothetical protein
MSDFPYPNWAVAVPLAAVLTICTLLVVRGRLLPDRLLSSPSLVGLAVAFFFVARPVYILFEQQTSIGASVDAVALTSGLRDSEVAALWTCVVFLVGVGAGILVPARAVKMRSGVVHLSVERLVAAVTVLVLVNVLSLYALVSSAGSVVAYLAGLAVRSTTLRGESYLGLAYLPLLIACGLLWVAVARQGSVDPDTRTRGARPVLWVGIVVGVLSAFASGGRAAVLLGCLLPLALVRSAVSGPLGRSKTLFLGLFAVVLFVGMSVTLRQRQFAPDANAGVLSATGAALSDLPGTMLGGTDARPFDSVLYLRSPDAERVSPLDGETYAAAWTYFVPRKLWPEKPFGGGNAWFTSVFAPRFYGSDRVETSVSAVGEAWANFRWLGVLGAGLLLGLALVAAERFRSRLSPHDGGTVLYALIAPTFISFIRGDAYHNVPLFLLIAGLYYAMVKISTVHPRVADTRQAAVNRIDLLPTAGPRVIGHLAAVGKENVK